MASNRLEKKDYLKTSLRAFFLQNGFNYGNYQGLGYANVMYPALRKLYKDDDDKLQEALRENIEFFNTNIHFLPFITSLHLVMLENKTPSKEILPNFRFCSFCRVSGVLQYDTFCRICRMFTGITAFFQINIDFSPDNYLQRIRTLCMQPAHSLYKKAVSLSFQCMEFHHKSIKLF